MTNDLDWNNLEKELEAQLAPDFSRALVAEKENENGARFIFIHPSRLLTHSEVVATCEKIGPLIRRKIPEKPDTWAVAILVERIFGDPMGIYLLGWSGRADEWRFSKTPTDHSDWLALSQRLKTLLLAHGEETPDGGEEGDFFMRAEDNGLPKLRLAVGRIEFLTPRLVAEIQALLRDGYTDWSVETRLFLSPPFDGIPPEGVEIWADEVVERWNRPRLKRRLGNRLKI